MGAASSAVLGSLLGPANNLSATDREARENLVNSLVAGIAASGDVSAATAAGSARIEVENNQVAPMAPVPGWLAGFKLPGYKGETASKGDGVIADPATELDPSIKTGALVTPTPGPGIIETLITAATPDWLRNLVTDAVTMAGDGPGNATLASGGNNNRLPIPEKTTANNGLKVESNPKHTPGMPDNRPNAAPNLAIRSICLTRQFPVATRPAMQLTRTAISIGSTLMAMASIIGPARPAIQGRQCKRRLFRLMFDVLLDSKESRC